MDLLLQILRIYVIIKPMFDLTAMYDCDIISEMSSTLDPRTITMIQGAGFLTPEFSSFQP
jgi:hypothetical protein